MFGGNAQESVLAFGCAPAQESGQAVALTPGSFSPQNIGSPDSVAVCGCIFLTFCRTAAERGYSRMARSGFSRPSWGKRRHWRLSRHPQRTRIAPVAVLSALIISMRVNAVTIPRRSPRAQCSTLPNACCQPFAHAVPGTAVG
ncbi:hypothetical protein KCP76_03565 [Salmonella enterica subsp. enterica serovar Weltevreden]|nr:hypothetical protein KCP76_03565 [Salmonella enterica subsp. enterica serovar Weltevreden]